MQLSVENCGVVFWYLGIGVIDTLCNTVTCFALEIFSWCRPFNISDVHT
jgi:hypothetical protein